MVEAQQIKLNLPKIENKKLLYWLGLIPILFITLYIRTRNLGLLQGKYLIELDSYFFFRYSRMLFEQGSVPAIDFMRYVPIGHPTDSLLFFPKTMVFFYKIIHAIFPNLSQIEWHIIYPPVITVISLIFFFLFIKELLGYKTAFFSTAFLAVIPAYLQRTGAGFADHEAVAMLWMFLSLWLFVLAWKNDNLKKLLPLTALSGIFAGMMAGTWGGYLFLSSGVSLFVAAYAILNPELDKKYFYQFLVWALAYFAVGSWAISRPGDMVGDVRNFAVIFAVLFLGIHVLARDKLSSLKLKIPTSIMTFLISAAIALAGGLATGKVTLALIKNILIKEEASRHFFTVSENAQPYFMGGWWQSFGWIFLLALAGSALFFFLLFKSEEKSRYKLDWLAGAAYIIFFSAFIFGRYSTDTKFPAIANFLSSTYLYWIAGFVLALGAIYLVGHYKVPEHLSKIKDKWPILLIAVWLLLTLLAARGQIRLLFAAVPPIAIAAGYAISAAANYSQNGKNIYLKLGMIAIAIAPPIIHYQFVSKDLFTLITIASSVVALIFGLLMVWLKQDKEKVLKYVTLTIILILAIFSFGVAAETSKAQNQYSGSMMPGQWESTMNWIKENTPTDSVFAHWWDYGHMTVAIGDRAAVTDGGNAKGWNHQSGRYFLTGKDDTETLTYLKTHNVTHILISEEEIPKYHAFSLIGSDENLDRASTIGIFAVQQQREVRDGTAILYGGGWGFDKDVVLDKLVLPKGQAFIGGFTILQGSDGSIAEAPVMHVIYNGQQIDLEASCLRIQETGAVLEFETNSTLKGCLVLVSYFPNQEQVSPSGAAFWLSEKIYDTNMAKLYIYGEESEYFKKVYDDGTPLGVYQGNIIGPIRIWEVNYPEDIQPDEFYLQSSEYG